MEAGVVGKVSEEPMVAVEYTCNWASVFSQKIAKMQLVLATDNGLQLDQ